MALGLNLQTWLSRLLLPFLFFLQPVGIYDGVHARTYNKGTSPHTLAGTNASEACGIHTYQKARMQIRKRLVFFTK